MEVIRKTTEYKTTIKGTEFRMVVEEKQGVIASVSANSQSSDPATAPARIWVVRDANGYNINAGPDVPFSTISAVVTAVDGLFVQPTETT